MTLKSEKIRAQVKSRFYYLFWGAATASVFAGQIFVGCGFRRMAETNQQISADINLLVETMIFLEQVGDDTPDYFQENMVIK
tara:strand:+ start:439 stop:684 length:246 start_codon:yes stop_codon:yes gene_type:complete